MLGGGGGDAPTSLFVWGLLLCYSIQGEFLICYRESAVTDMQKHTSVLKLSCMHVPSCQR